MSVAVDILLQIAIDRTLKVWHKVNSFVIPVLENLFIPLKENW